MADEPVVENQQPPPATDPAVEAEARRGGWTPKEAWRGVPEAWVDAKTFVDRGRQILPHVQRANQQLQRQLSEQQAAHQRELEELRQQVAGLTEFRADVATRERERMREDIRKEMKDAREKGDLDAETRAIEKLGQVREPAAPARSAGGRADNGGGATPPGGTTPRQPAQLPQELVDWTAANPWYQQDAVLQQAMNVIGAEMRSSGQLTGLSLTEQLDATAKVVLQRYAPAPAARQNSVEGGGRTGAGGGGGGTPAGGDGWDSLPANIKRECDDQGRRLGLIGEKKTFKTIADWRKHYVQEYTKYRADQGYDYNPKEDQRPAWMDQT